jgi:hypothetical protein
MRVRSFIIAVAVGGLAAVGVAQDPPRLQGVIEEVARRQKLREELASRTNALYFAEFRLPALRDVKCSPGEVRVRLVHVHHDQEPRPLPSPKAIAIDITGRIGGSAEILVDDDHAGYRWRRGKLLPSVFAELIGVVLSEDFLSMKRPLPIATAGYEFIVEVATESRHQCIDTHYIRVDSALGRDRGLGRTQEVALKILKVAGIPDDQIFWGPEAKANAKKG